MSNYGADFLSPEQLAVMPFRSLGADVSISARAVLVGIENMAIGDHVRIDPDAVILATGPVDIGSYVHVSAQCYLAGGAGIEMADFSGLSQGVKLYSVSDDYSGGALTNPTVPAKYLSLTRGKILLGRHTIIGAGSVVLPGVVFGEGAAVGALSLVRKDVAPWTIVAGVPARRVAARKRDLLERERDLLAEHRR
jgi:galactoside O-acetyltransferase